ncbi:MAG: c-type cytochrome domain-containing protein, partial [Haliangium ochraceum]
IVQPNCATANCHSILSQRSGVRLDGIELGYQQLVGRHFVVEGRPDSSALVALLKGEGSRRMPPDFALPKVDIDLISRWIANGAPRRGLGSPADLDAGAGN